MFSTVPYLVSAVTCRGRGVHRNRVRHRRSRRFVLLHLGGGHEGQRNDASLTAINDVVVLRAQVRVPIPLRQRRSVEIGGADAPVGRAREIPLVSLRLGRPALPIPRGGARRARPNGCTTLTSGQPVAAQAHRLLSLRISIPVLPVAVVLLRDDVSEMRLRSDAGPRRAHGGVGRNVGGITGHFFAPDQPDRGALLHDRLEEVAEDLQSIPLPNARQARMVRKRLGQVIAERVSAGSTAQ
jgi:hypothetical protein